MPSRTDPAISLTSYRNYLRALRYYIAACYGHRLDQPRSISHALEQLPGYMRIESGRPSDWDRVAQLLNSAWQTEIVLNLPRFSSDEGAKALSIHWGTIQVYFAVYSAASAWLVAKLGDTAPKGHRSTLNMLSAMADTHNLFPAPWSFVCRTLEPQSFGGIGLYSPSPINNTRSPGYDDCLDYICSALRVVRKRAIDEKATTWKSKMGLDRLPPGHRRRIEADLCSTSLFNFLWLLRRRAQYGDAEFLMLGRNHASEAENFYECLWRVASATLFVFEKLIVAKFGVDPAVELANQLLERSDTARETVGPRLRHWRGMGQPQGVV